MGDNYSLQLRAAVFAMRVYMAVDRAIRPVRTVTTADGVRMACDTRDFVPRRIAYFRTYEHALTGVVRRTLRSGDVFIDVGANVGYFTLLAARLVGTDGHVVAIEADPAMHAKLSRNVALNPGATVSTRQVAVTAEPCLVAMRTHDAKNLGANYAVVDDNADVEGQPLDVLLGDVLDAATFIKVDIEGAEGPALDVILDRLPSMSSRLTIAVEVVAENIAYLERFRDAGFEVQRLPNSYDIETYVAHRLGWSGVDTGGSDDVGDYVLTRQ